MPSRPFLFLRHGQTDWNLAGRIQGHTDIALNATGREQARVAALRLKNRGIDRIVSSPLQRAFATARAVADLLDVPLHEDAALKERSYGAFEGRIRDEIRIEYGIPPDEPIRAIVPPDAEPWNATCDRARSVVCRWLDAHPGDALLFVSHDGIFRVLHEQLVGTRPSAGNATPYLFQPGGERWTVTELNDA
jgi:broad specificity phosphatase PhoE